jgi:hypothetical protein
MDGAPTSNEPYTNSVATTHDRTLQSNINFVNRVNGTNGTFLPPPNRQRRGSAQSLVCPNSTAFALASEMATELSFADGERSESNMILGVDADKLKVDEKTLTNYEKIKMKELEIKMKELEIKEKELEIKMKELNFKKRRCLLQLAHDHHEREKDRRQKRNERSRDRINESQEGSVDQAKGEARKMTLDRVKERLAMLYILYFFIIHCALPPPVKNFFFVTFCVTLCLGEFFERLLSYCSQGPTDTSYWPCGAINDASLCFVICAGWLMYSHAA